MASASTTAHVQFDDISEERTTQPVSLLSLVSSVLSNQPTVSSVHQMQTTSTNDSMHHSSPTPQLASVPEIPFVNEDEIVELAEVEYPTMEPIVIRGEGNITLFGLSNMFNTDFPNMLIGRISKEEFQSSIGRINALLRTHHSTNVKLMLLGCLCCCCSLGCSLLWPTLALSKRTRCSLEKLLAEENAKLYHRLGFNWRLAKKAAHNNTAFMEYVILIEFLPKLHLYQPD